MDLTLMLARFATNLMLMQFLYHADTTLHVLIAQLGAISVLFVGCLLMT
jgi:CBS-domain-containing membrane protein